MKGKDRMCESHVGAFPSNAHGNPRAVRRKPAYASRTQSDTCRCDASNKSSDVTETKPESP